MENIKKKLPNRVKLKKKPKKLGEWRDVVSKSVLKTVQGIEHLEKGQFLCKIRKKRFRGVQRYKRKFRLDFRKLYIHYSPANNAVSKNLYRVAPNKLFRFDMADIIEVRKGFSTDTFNHVERLTEKSSSSTSIFNPDYCLSIIFDHTNRKNDNYTLDLVFDNQTDRDSWYQAIDQLIECMKEVEYQKEYELYLRNTFSAADKSKNGYLFLDEFTLLLKQINISMQPDEVQKVFDEANFHKSEVEDQQVLDEEEFLKFFHKLLFRPEVSDIFEQVSVKYKGLAITPYELEMFLTKIQGEDVNFNDCINIIKDYEIKDQKVLKKVNNLYLSWKGFLRFIMGSSLFNITSKFLQVDQDMTQPLCNYYINTSHNTYLVGNQVTSDSSIDGYIRALVAGCRCVELDCWNGSEGEPVVYHGWTLTSKLKLRHVLTDAIKPYAFKTSPYPVILSIENHLNREQQDQMAILFKEILGDLLYTDSVDKSANRLPSPDQLKYKILVKGKKLRMSRGTGSLDEEAPETRRKSSSSATSQTSSQTKPKDEIVESELPIPPKVPPRKSRMAEFKKQSAVQKTSLDEDGGFVTESTYSHLLSEIINYCEAVKFKDFDQERNYWEMSSFDENKTNQVVSSSLTASKFVAYNQTNLSRIYPKGTRLMSSNLDPLPPWLVGCQMVALNFQQPDKYNQINSAWFQPNGGCGYVLKPKYLREANDTYSYSTSDTPVKNNKKVMNVKVKLISGQHLPNASDRQAGDIIEPYVKIRILGHPQDNCEWISSTVPKNGFNPSWDETAEFQIKYPELALLEFKVKSKAKLVDNLDDYLGSCMYSLPLVKTGYRNVALKSYSGKRLTPANLFVNIQKENI